MIDTFLLCDPEFFGVDYIINPWMVGNVANCDQELAINQWNNLVKLLSRRAAITTLGPVYGLPDMVFTANAGLILGNIFVPSRFKHDERKGEEMHFIESFESAGFTIMKVPDSIAFEGAGDALFDRLHQNYLWMGYGHRTDLECAEWLERNLSITVMALELVDDRFYHLDTCFCPLYGGNIMYYPAAFSEESRALIEAVPAERRIIVSEADALHFACNAVNTKEDIFLNQVSNELKEELEARGYVVHQTPLSEFMKAGGSAKCLTLKLNER